MQIDGTSILGQGGVANIPLATANKPGAVKGSASYGIAIDGTGLAYVSRADATLVKAGTNGYRAITPSMQDQSVFYALAKLAGADLANETVTVGQYPPAALTAIQKMLGMYEAPWELIREDSITNATEGDLTINVDDDGQPFELTDVRGIIWFPTQENESKITNGTVTFYSGANLVAALAVDVRTNAVNATKCGAYIMLEQKHGMIHTKSTSWHNSSVMGTVRMTMRMEDDQPTYPFIISNEVGITSVGLKKITGTLNYRIYGRRKWRT